MSVLLCTQKAPKDTKITTFLQIVSEPVKPPELSGEPSVLVFDKQVPTASDLQQGVTRRQTKKDVDMVYVCGKSEEARKLAASHQTPFKGNNTAKLIIPNKRFGQSYDPFVPVDKKMSKELTEWVNCDLYYKTPKKKTTYMSKSVLSHPPNSLCMAERRSKSSAIYLPWTHKYPEFKSDKGDLNGLGLDVDDIFAPVNFRNEHWISISISIPKKHIVVWDSIHSHISPEDLDVFSNKNAKAMREKMGLDIFKETPGCHSKENEDNDENIATYDEEG
ncbi:hypothetical protein F2Q70_00021873 [Brassica cretica]|uniref:Ubiquitin-like protease family profile domain-containing protein n=1 Tax=Brassica cretica TaxID=69181 RepID=A0A8S9GLU3_BRACR|nr:hypothetical protein F2Q70_00021873 [Brassica cretica]